MPIYEFYCRKCDTVYNFFSRSCNTEEIPLCPQCKTIRLKRQMSLFAKISRGKGENESQETDMDPPVDEARMEKAMAMLAQEADNMNDDDPRQAALMMRKLADVAGIGMGKGMEEALSRIEEGEDPEKIEAEMGDLLTEGGPFLLEGGAKIGRKARPKPRVDETLYEL